MKLTGKFIVTERYAGKGRFDYLTAVDLENGGTLRVGVPREFPVKLLVPETISIEVRGRQYDKNYTLSMVVPAEEPAGDGQRPTR